MLITGKINSFVYYFLTIQTSIWESGLLFFLVGRKRRCKLKKGKLSDFSEGVHKAKMPISEMETFTLRSFHEHICLQRKCKTAKPGVSVSCTMMGAGF